MPYYRIGFSIIVFPAGMEYFSQINVYPYQQSILKLRKVGFGELI
uniref:Uncharacterized protein n=1 Tax=Arundo donax TaxID=35708 RepID=A0A0A9DH36_ARUDO